MEWTAMLILGAYHGVNPGMGWLFAVALGMQQGSARGVWRALPPIAIGHAFGRRYGPGSCRSGGSRDPVTCSQGRHCDGADHVRRLPALASSAPAIWRDAGRLPRPDGLVVSDGVGTRGWFHAAAVGDVHAVRCLGGRWRARIPPPSVSKHRRAVGRHHRGRRAHGRVSHCDDAGRVGRVPQAGARVSAHRVVRLDWVWAGALVVECWSTTRSASMRRSAPSIAWMTRATAPAAGATTPRPPRVDSNLLQAPPR